MSENDVLFTLVLAVAARDITVAVLRYRAAQKAADRKAGKGPWTFTPLPIADPAPKEPKP